jgi:glycosyltransferase involved in cell wall biosynthesis
MPVCNGERYLEYSLHGVLLQTYPNFELLISDNGSTDRTAEICEHFANMDDRIRYWRNPANIGAAGNYNLVLKEARGEYFCWLSYDDLQYRKFLQRCVEVLDDAPASVGLVFPRAYLVDESGIPVTRDEVGAPLLIERLSTTAKYPYQRLADVLAVLKWSTAQFGLWRTELLRRTRGMDAFLYSDRVLLVEAALLGQIREIDEPLFAYRRHKQNSTIAHTTEESYLRWMNPETTKTTRPRLFSEYAKSVRRLPLSPLERILCYAVLCQTWATQKFDRYVSNRYCR